MMELNKQTVFYGAVNIYELQYAWGKRVAYQHRIQSESDS